MSDLVWSTSFCDVSMVNTTGFKVVLGLTDW